MRGHDYRAHVDFDKPVQVLRNEAQEILAAGGFRRVENGETFIHSSDGIIAFEVYDNLRIKEK